MGILDWIKEHPIASVGIATAGALALKKYGDDQEKKQLHFTKTMIDHIYSDTSMFINITMFILLIVLCNSFVAISAILLVLGVINLMTNNNLAASFGSYKIYRTTSGIEYQIVKRKRKNDYDKKRGVYYITQKEFDKMLSR